MASEAPAHSFLLPRLTALVDEAVANGIARDVAVAVLIDLITAPPFNTSSIDPSANDAPQPDYDRSPDDPVLVGGVSVTPPRTIGQQGDADFTRNPTWRE